MTAGSLFVNLLAQTVIQIETLTLAPLHEEGVRRKYRARYGRASGVQLRSESNTHSHLYGDETGWLEEVVPVNHVVIVDKVSRAIPIWSSSHTIAGRVRLRSGVQDGVCRD